MIFLICIVSGCSTLHDDRLFGTWISDKEKTLCVLEKSRDLTEKQRRWFENNLGKLRIKYTKENVTFWYEGEPTTERLIIAAKDKDSVVLVCKDPFDEEDKLVMITFEDNDIYWIYSDLGNYIEYFRKLKD